ncbi:mannose-1-phosphate guanylyltransferase/mannose-6-phosphate isomerase [Campylobacter mucosalis]|uniref:mannose-1-phosphate guanylyltransferase/mannose-6-phosphate isomerase n=1 Tax=Campylobacter mucosalis TaxID=202 RepID=UPI00147045BA
MTNIILCGGSGTRLWPISRALLPKQFIKIFNNHSLFQLSITRNLKVCDKLLVVSNAQQYFISLDQLEEINVKDANYILEPVAKNTAPAIAISCMSLNDDDIVLVTPSDHLIKNEANYIKMIKEGEEFAKNDHLVVFGIKPTSPNTGFGYIKADGKNVEKFCEKPTLELAKQFVENGNFYWNSGIFMFKAGVFLNELKKYSPKIYESAKIAFDNSKKDNLIRIKHDDMLNIPSDSIDYAVMEHCKNTKVVFADIGWSDLGSFDSLYYELEKDENGNTKSENHISLNSNNNLIFSNKKIATIDVDDLAIIDTNDALLICKKGSSQKVKDVVEILKDSELVKSHDTTYRPWGSYTILESGLGYKIKRIVVKPGKRLSLQKHFHRNEHWIVVSGTASVTIGENTFLLRENESTYIKMGEIHRLANEGRIPVVLIEAQVGEYTGEDDIVRIEDDFNRGRMRNE